jgi:hypothetical protein
MNLVFLYKELLFNDIQYIKYFLHNFPPICLSFTFSLLHDNIDKNMHKNKGIFL